MEKPTYEELDKQVEGLKTLLKMSQENEVMCLGDRQKYKERSEVLTVTAQKQAQDIIDLMARVKKADDIIVHCLDCYDCGLSLDYVLEHGLEKRAPHSRPPELS